MREITNYTKSNEKPLAHAPLFRIMDTRLAELNIDLTAEHIQRSSDIEIIRMLEQVRRSAQEGRYNAGAGPGEWERIS
jgi:hypothetical protein